MPKFIKCLLVLAAGTLCIMIVGRLTNYWSQLFSFGGPIILLATIISAIVNNKHGSRKTGSVIMFWSGVAALIIHVMIYSGPKAITPNYWEVVLTCFILGAGLSQLVYYIKTKSFGEIITPPLP